MFDQNRPCDFSPCASILLPALLLLNVPGWQPARAQTPIPTGQRIIHQLWTFRDGAPDTPLTIVQTVDGYLWVGSAAGLYRFDGVRFELFRSPFGDKLLRTNVSRLFAPSSGGLWVGYAFGGFSFVRNGSVKNFAEGSTGTVQSFAQDRSGTVWAAATSGLWRFNGSSWEHQQPDWNLPTEPFWQVGFDREGALWALTESLAPGVRKELFYLPPGARRFRKAGNVLVQGFTWDADHTVLTTKPSRPAEGEREIQFEDALPAHPVLRKNSSQIVDRTNGIWVILRDPFVLRHPAGEPLEEVLNQISASNSDAYDVNAARFGYTVDREGNVWIPAANGVHRFSYSPLIQQEFPKNEAGPYFALAPDEGGVAWVSAGSGTGSSRLYRLVNGNAELLQSQPGSSHVAYRAPDKTLWFAGEGGIWRFANGAITKLALPPDVSSLSPNILTMTQDHLGAMWVSFGRRLYRYAGGAWALNGGRRDLPNAPVFVEFTDELGRVWFGYPNNTLALLDGDSVRVFGPREGVQVGNLTAIFGKASRIWVGGEFGLLRFEDGRFRNIESMDPEALRGISGIVEAANGDLWLNGLGGIVHVRHQEILSAERNPSYQVRVERLGRRDGLPGLAAQLTPLPSAIEGTDGRLWFPVPGGVVWLDPARPLKQILPPPVTIETVSIDDRAYPVDQPIRVSPRASEVKITYRALSLSDPESIRYRYKLPETDADWREAATSTSVSFRNLSPGLYHFVVSASGGSGLWSEKAAVLEFTVMPAFYQTTWFRALGSAAFLSFLWAAYLFRVRQLEREFKRAGEARLSERMRIARQLHDNLLQTVQGFVLRLEVAKTMMPPGTARDELEDALQIGDRAIVEGRQTVEELRTSLYTGELAREIQKLGGELRRPGGPAFQLFTRGPECQIVPDVQDEVFSIVREAIRNAFAHARATRIEAEILFDGRLLLLRVRDNGKGIAPEILEKGREGHYGLAGMRERAAALGAELTVSSAPPNGTEIKLTVPASVAYRKPNRFGLSLLRRS